MARTKVDEIYTTIATMKAEVQELGALARERAHTIREHGLTFGTGRERLVTGGTADYEAPKCSVS
jgi:hypothetical protein